MSGWGIPSQEKAEAFKRQFDDAAELVCHIVQGTDATILEPGINNTKWGESRRAKNTRLAMHAIEHAEKFLQQKIEGIRNPKTIIPTHPTDPAQKLYAFGLLLGIDDGGKFLIERLSEGGFYTETKSVLWNEVKEIFPRSATHYLADYELDRHAMNEFTMAAIQSLRTYPTEPGRAMDAGHTAIMTVKPPRPD
jgi:hypothetical protein